MEEPQKDTMLLALKMEEEAESHKMWVVSTNCERHKDKRPLGSPERHTALEFSPVRPTWDF